MSLLSSRVRLRAVIVTALGLLVLIGLVHDGEAPDLADLVDNRLHHEKLEAWLLLAFFVVAMWPRAPCTHRRVHAVNLTPGRIPGRTVFVCDNRRCQRIFTPSEAAVRSRARREPFSTHPSIPSWKGGRATRVTSRHPTRTWPAVAQYVVLVTSAKDRETLTAVVEQASEHLSKSEYSALEYFATNRERELVRDGRFET